jgi:hypothetical protein
VKLRTRQGPSFIFLKSVYSNSKEWEKQVFRVSGEWECPKSTKLTESQRISWEWRALDGGLTNPPEISDAEQEEVTRMIEYCKSHHKVENDFDAIVTSKSLNDHLGYNEVPLTKTGKPKAMKAKVLATFVPSCVPRESLRTRNPPLRLPESRASLETFRKRRTFDLTSIQPRGPPLSLGRRECPAAINLWGAMPLQT